LAVSTFLMFVLGCVAFLSLVIIVFIRHGPLGPGSRC